MTTEYNPQAGDIVRWSYKEYKPNTEQYWCCSCIAEVFEKDNGELFLQDTYWMDTTGRSFSVEDIGTKIEVEYICNKDDIVPCSKYDFSMYSKEDCIDLSHPNCRGLYFLRKGAKKDAGKMKRCLEAHKEYYKRQSEMNMIYAEDMQKRLDTFDDSDLDGMYLPNEKGVWWE